MAAKSKSKAGAKKTNEPTIENRRARRSYLIENTLECGIKLTGTEVKSIRAGQISLAEGFARATEHPLALTLHGVHIAEYPPAGPHRQHMPTRARVLLAQKREIRKLYLQTLQRGTTLIPLKLYFVRGRAKLLIGVARGRRKTDKRQTIDRRESKKELRTAMERR